MNASTKKYVIAGAIGAVTIAGALAYLQYKRLMNYEIKFKSLKPKKLVFDNFDFDIFVDFKNKSDVTFTIEKQVYTAFINDIFVTKIENLSSVTLPANAVTPMGLNVKFNPKDVLSKIGSNAVNLVLNADKTIIKVECKLKVKLWFFTINIPYVYQESLKNMINPPVENV
jgi:LEA14-like dessication related protein